MIRPVRGRASFRALHLEGRRARFDGVRITYRAPTGADHEPDRGDDPDPLDEEVFVAYAIGRAVGPAVVRNRLRRRLRHLLRELEPTLLPPGTYLFHLAPATAGLSFQELSDTVIRALENLRDRR